MPLPLPLPGPTGGCCEDSSSGSDNDLCAWKFRAAGSPTLTDRTVSCETVEAEVLVRLIDGADSARVKLVSGIPAFLSFNRISAISRFF